MMTRREAIKTAMLASAALAIPGRSRSQAAPPEATPAPEGGGVYPFVLPPLGYGFDALEPYIDAKTMEIHHDKHHAAYVAKLNEALKDAPAALKAKTVDALLADLDAVPEAIRTAVRNQGGGHANHSFFWKLLKKNPGGKPSGDLAAAIDKTFGSFADFQKQFGAAAGKVFGSGWAWLVRNPDGNLAIVSTANQDSPLMNKQTPIVGVDVWEHAYYLKHQNRRAEYVQAFQDVIDWDFAARQYAGAEKK